MPNVSAAARLPVYVLAGGRSRRFGSDKARALLEGEPLILHACRGFAHVAASMTVVAATPGEYADLGLRTIGDLELGLGPLGGLAAALADRGDGWLLLGACDLLGLDRAWVSGLVEAARAPDFDVIALRGAQRWEPMPALYHSRLRQRVTMRLLDGRRALQHLIDESRALAVPLPAGWLRAAQLNTPEDVERFARRAAPA